MKKNSQIVRFGTDGIRAVAGVWPLDRPTVRRIGAAVARLVRVPAFHRGCAGPRGRGAPAVLVGRDTRPSGRWIERELAGALVRGGVRVLYGDILPSPAVACLVRHLGCAGGVVISASHNPARYNGIKVFSPDGAKISRRWERFVERSVAASRGPRRVGRSVSERLASAGRLYAFEILRAAGLDLSGMRIVVDCAYGATGPIAPGLFRAMGARVFAMNATCSGSRINDRCGALHPERMAREVVRRGADIGFSFDGDGDRLMLADHRGTIRDGDDILAVVGADWALRGRLSGKRIVATVLSNLGLDMALGRVGVRLVRCPVGERDVVETMKRERIVVGGEQAGHIVFMRHVPTGDGIWTAVEILSIMCRRRRRLAALCRGTKVYPQVAINVPVRRLPLLETVPAVRAAEEEARKALGARGRLVLRYSGTEPVARIMIERERLATIRRLAEGLAEAVRRAIG